MSSTTSKIHPPIKVSFVLPKTYPLFNPDCMSPFGGAEVDFYYLSTELAKDSDFQVSCIVGDFGQPKIEHRENVTLIRSLNLNKNPVIGACKLWHALRQADAHIYMLETPSLGLPLVAMFCKINKRKLAYRTASTREADGTYLKQHPILGRIFIASLKHSDMVFTQNQQDKTKLESKFKIPAVVAANGHTIPPVSDAPRQTILWLGRSAEVKRPDLFLKLAQEFPDQHFTMICQQATNDTNYSQLQSKAEQIKNLEFISRVPFHHTAAYFQKAKVLVNTSDSEGFPNTFIQACLAATPILSLSVNPDNFLTEHNLGLCANGDCQIFKNMLNQILQPGMFQQLSANGRKYVEQYHNIQTIAARYKAAFNKLLQR